MSDRSSVTGTMQCPQVRSPGRDSSARDSSVRDSSVRDSSVRDSSVRDSSVRDSSVRDSSVRDSSASDSSVRDGLVSRQSSAQSSSSARPTKSVFQSWLGWQPPGQRLVQNEMSSPTTDVSSDSPWRLAGQRFAQRQMSSPVRECSFRDSSVRDSSFRDSSVRDSSSRDSSVRDSSFRDSSVRDSSFRDSSMRDSSSRHSSVRDSSSRDSSMRDSSVRDSSVRDSSSRDSSVSGSSARDRSVRDSSVRDNSLRDSLSRDSSVSGSSASRQSGAQSSSPARPTKALSSPTADVSPASPLSSHSRGHVNRFLQPDSSVFGHAVPTSTAQGTEARSQDYSARHGNSQSRAKTDKDRLTRVCYSLVKLMLDQPPAAAASGRLQGAGQSAENALPQDQPSSTGGRVVVSNLNGPRHLQLSTGRHTPSFPVFQTGHAMMLAQHSSQAACPQGAPPAFDVRSQRVGNLSPAEPFVMPAQPCRQAGVQTGAVIGARSAVGRMMTFPVPAVQQQQGQNGPGQRRGKRRTRGLRVFARPHCPSDQILSMQTTFGSQGRGCGELNEANGLTLCGLGQQIAVADTNNSRVQVFTLDGQYQYQFPTMDTAPGARQRRLYPCSIAVAPNFMFAVCFRNPSPQVKLFARYGQELASLGEGVLQNPRAIAVTPAGDIIVVENKVFKVHIFRPSAASHGNRHLFHHSVFHLGPQTGFPVDVAVWGNEIYVCDNQLNCVKVYDFSGTLQRTIGYKGLTDCPVKVLITARGSVLVASNHDSFHVVVFDILGRYQTTFRSTRKSEDVLDVALDESTRTLIATCSDDMVYRYTIPNVQITL